MNKIGWGIAGLGKIAHSFARDLLLVPDAELIAVASSSATRAQEFGAQYQAKKKYDNYAALYEDSEVQIIYIASLHPHHKAMTIAALEAGKAVLCEKPLTMSTSDVRELMDVAKRTGVFCMEALWTRFNPTFAKAEALIANGSIGPLRYINASFSFNGLDRDEDSRLFNPSKGGGTLLDIGIYPLFLAYQLLGKPKDIQASALLTTQGIDAQLSLLLTYEKAHAVLHSSVLHDEDMQARICGEKGAIYIGSRWHESPEIKWIVEDEVQEEKFDFVGKGYSYEIEESHRCLREGLPESPKWTLSNSLELMELMESILKQCGIQYPQN